MYFNNLRQGRQEVWIYLVSLSIIIFSYLIIGPIPYFIVYLVENSSNPVMQNSLQGVDQNVVLLIMLVPSLLAFFSILLTMKYIHGFKLLDVASVKSRIRWNRVFIGGALWLILLLAIDIYQYRINPENYTFRFELSQFLPLLAITLFIIPLQAWSEELFFRSYLMNGIVHFTGMRTIALLLTSVAFGMLHLWNPEVKEFGMGATMQFYIGFGLFTGLLVILDSGIELACIVHAVNNMYSASLVGYKSSVLDTASLWKVREMDMLTANIGFFASAIIFMIVMKVIFRWKMKKE